MSETDTINLDIRQILDTATVDCGVEVTLVELKDIQLPGTVTAALTRPGTSMCRRALRAALAGSARTPKDHGAAEWAK